MSHLGDCLKVRDVVSWVSNALKEYSLGVLIDSCSEILRLVPVDEFGVDAQPWKQDFQLVIGSPVEVAGRHNVVPDVRQRGKGHELGCLAGTCCDGCDSTFEGGDSLFEDIDRGLRVGNVSWGLDRWKEYAGLQKCTCTRKCMKRRGLERLLNK